MQMSEKTSAWSQPLTDEQTVVGTPMTTTGGEPSYASPTSPPSSASSTTAAKDQAAQVSQGAAEAGKRVAAVAGDEAGRVAGEAKRQARDVIEQAGSQVREQAGQQQERIAANLRAMSDELAAMAGGSPQQGTASELARQASIRASEVASWLEQRDPRALVAELRSFARRRPGTFLAVAAAAGVVAGRVTRGLTASRDDEVPEVTAVAPTTSAPRAIVPEAGSPELGGSPYGAGAEEIQTGLGDVGSAGYASGLPPVSLPVEPIEPIEPVEPVRPVEEEVR
jgi:hypothetical protein